jgi:hypothetical protein
MGIFIAHVGDCVPLAALGAGPLAALGAGGRTERSLAMTADMSLRAQRSNLLWSFFIAIAIRPVSIEFSLRPISSIADPFEGELQHI